MRHRCAVTVHIQTLRVTDEGGERKKKTLISSYQCDGDTVKCNSGEESGGQTLKIHRGLCRVSCAVRWCPTPAMIFWQQQTHCASWHKLSCMYELLAWSPFAFTSPVKFFISDADAKRVNNPCVFQWNRRRGPAMEEVRLPPPLRSAPWPRFLRWSSKMLEIPPVPFGVACSQKCASAAAAATTTTTALPWPWESLDIEFKRPVNARYQKEREGGEHSTVM